MNLRLKLTERLERAKSRAEHLLSQTSDRARSITRQAVNRFTGISESDQQALSQFVRPDLGTSKLPARVVLEPMIAVTAVALLAGSLGLGLVSFVGLLVAGWIIFAILTYVFGLELDIAFPST